MMADNVDDVIPDDVDDPPSPPREVDVEKLVSSRVDEAVKALKEKLDKAYEKRDETLKKLAEIENEKKEAERKRLQEEGKHKEAFEIESATMKAKIEALEKRNVELTRDIEVRNSLSAHPFRNENASEMAYREVVEQLVQDENGNWKHNTGISIKDFVKAFAEDENNAFLFRQKQSSGAGSSSAKPGTSSTSKSIFEMSQEEVLKLAMEGKLPGRK
jgi:hypothetical protein